MNLKQTLNLHQNIPSIPNDDEQYKSNMIEVAYPTLHNLDEMDLPVLLSIPIKEIESSYRHLNFSENKISIWRRLNAFYWNHTLLIKIILFCMYYTVGISYYSSVEGWSVFQSAFYITEAIATIGSNSITDTQNSSDHFSVPYLTLGNLLIISFAITFVGTSLDYAQDEILHLLQKIVHTKNIYMNKKRAQLYKFYFSLLVVCIGLLIGTLFYHGNENWQYIQSFYWSISVMTTVGYGAVSIHHTTSLLFGVFFIYYIVFSYVFALNTFKDYWTNTVQRRKFRQSLLTLTTDHFGSEWFQNILGRSYESKRVINEDMVIQESTPNRGILTRKNSDYSIYDDRSVHYNHKSPSSSSLYILDSSHIDNQDGTNTYSKIHSYPSLPQINEVDVPCVENSYMENSCYKTNSNDHNSGYLKVSANSTSNIMDIQPLSSSSSDQHQTFPTLLHRDYTLKRRYSILGQSHVSTNACQHCGHDQGCSKEKFILHTLVELGVISYKHHINPLVQKFRELDRNHSGHLTTEDLMRFKEYLSSVGNIANVHSDNIQILHTNSMHINNRSSDSDSNIHGNTDYSIIFSPIQQSASIDPVSPLS